MIGLDAREVEIGDHDETVEEDGEDSVVVGIEEDILAVCKEQDGDNGGGHQDVDRDSKVRRSEPNDFFSSSEHFHLFITINSIILFIHFSLTVFTAYNPQINGRPRSLYLHSTLGADHQN